MADQVATRAARANRPVVFAPPIATFSNPDGAAETDLQNGLALSVECDKQPTQARQKLESLLGPATIIIASGGEWPDPETGELEPKLHLHWRLTDLPEPLAQLSRHKLEALAREALDEGLLVKSRTEQTQGAPKYLDIPEGPLALGHEVQMFQGSRKEALARYRARTGTG